MASHSSTLAWKIPWTGEPGGLPSMGSHRVGYDWSDLAAAAATSQINVDGWDDFYRTCSYKTLIEIYLTLYSSENQTRACTQAIYWGNIISGSKRVRPDALKRKGGNASAKALSRQIVLWMTHPQPDQDLLKSGSGSLSVVSLSLGPHGLGTSRFLCPWDSPSKNTGVDCHALLQMIFLTLGLTPDLLHYKEILYCLSHQEPRSEASSKKYLKNK